MLIQKKTLWMFLILLFIFDNVVSYFAISYLGGREANRLIAPIVEKYPLLYFLCILAEILIMFVIVWIIKKVATRILKKWNFTNVTLERMVLQGTVIYWAVANSSPNLFFLIGLRLPINTWSINSLIGVFVTAVYVFLTLRSKKIVRDSHV